MEDFFIDPKDPYFYYYYGKDKGIAKSRVMYNKEIGKLPDLNKRDYKFYSIKSQDYLTNQEILDNPKFKPKNEKDEVTPSLDDLSNETNSIDGYLHAAKIYDLKAQWMESIYVYTKIIIELPDLIDAYIKRGKAFIEINRFENAIEDFFKAIELGDKSQQTLSLLKKAWLGLKKQTEVENKTKIENTNSNTENQKISDLQSGKIGIKDQSDNRVNPILLEDFHQVVQKLLKSNLYSFSKEEIIQDKPIYPTNESPVKSNLIEGKVSGESKLYSLSRKDIIQDKSIYTYNELHSTNKIDAPINHRNKLYSFTKENIIQDGCINSPKNLKAKNVINDQGRELNKNKAPSNIRGIKGRRSSIENPSPLVKEKNKDHIKLTKFLSRILIAILVILFGWWAVYQYRKGYNEAIAKSVIINQAEIDKTRDSLAYYLKQYEYYYEIEQLSFTYPATPRHVKQQELFEVQEKVQYFRNRAAYLKVKIATLEAGGG